MCEKKPGIKDMKLDSLKEYGMNSTRCWTRRMLFVSCLMSEIPWEPDVTI